MKNDLQLPAGQRKKLLLLQGQMFRLGVIEAKQTLAANLHAEALVKSAVSHLVDGGTEAARQLFTLDALLDGRLGMFLPVLASSAGFLSRRHLLKPAAIIAALGATGYLGWRIVTQRQNKVREQSSDEFSGEQGQPSWRK
ncbi:hypothetical protein [Lacisediminimonas profundi]|uniref:hypothetical protein n=1 Tax=Lacisediminimonas profundi TaxID=2603856 RepID=UPI00124B0D26|nr:hypothetical protein [Lacisediminimonas profundi]